MGDVHGHREALDRLLTLILDDARMAVAEGLEPVVVFLGDYVDRGPESRAVVERLCAAPSARGIAWRFIRGNHENALLDFLRDPVRGAEWLEYGGIETLASYGVRGSVGIRERARCTALRDRFRDALPDAHKAFLDGLEPMVVLGDYAFVHAGVRPGRSLDRQRMEDLMCIREPFLSDSRYHGKVVVHGHTMVDQPDFRGNRIAIDTGAYMTGVLTALVLQETKQCLIQAQV